MFRKEKQNDTKARVHVDSFALRYIFCLLSNPYGLPLSELKRGHLHFLLYINSHLSFLFSHTKNHHFCFITTSPSLSSISLTLSQTHFEIHLASFHFKEQKTMPEAPKSSLKQKNEKALKFIESVTENADEVQKRVLGEILAANAHVEYLQRHGLNGHTDRETFKKVMPVITYDHIQPDINRIANGDTSQILCSKPISEFLTRFGLEPNKILTSFLCVGKHFLSGLI